MFVSSVVRDAVMAGGDLTPFGEKLRQLRAQRGITQAQLARRLGVSPAYLSALEHGKRGVPRWIFVQAIIGELNVIWDEADELQRLALLSDPKVTIDTSSLSPVATQLANTLAQAIGRLDDDTMVDLIVAVEAAHKRARNR